MKMKVVIIFFLLALFALPMTDSICSAQDKTTIGVLKVNCNNWQIGDVIAESLTTDLAKIKSLNVVERNALSQVFSEQILSADGLVESLQAGSGQGMGLQYVLIGSATAQTTQSWNKYSNQYDYRSTVSLYLKLIDAYDQIGHIVWSGQRTTENFNNDIVTTANEAAYDMARQIYDQFPVQGYILKSSQGKIYIDLGERDGLKKDDKLVVEGVSETIIHPITGEKIVTKKVVGELKVCDVFYDFCTAQVSEDPFKVYPGDIVKRKICKKPKGFLGLGWSGKHAF